MRSGARRNAPVARAMTKSTELSPGLGDRRSPVGLAPSATANLPQLASTTSQWHWAPRVQPHGWSRNSPRRFSVDQGCGWSAEDRQHAEAAAMAFAADYSAKWTRALRDHRQRRPALAVLQRPGRALDPPAHHELASRERTQTGCPRPSRRTIREGPLVEPPDERSQGGQRAA